LEIVEPAHRRPGAVQDFPTNVGLVFADGDFTQTMFENRAFRVVDQDENEVRVTAVTTAYWDEARTSVKWLLLHFKASTDGHYVFADQAAALPVRATKHAWEATRISER
jgi:hypothetical protein